MVSPPPHSSTLTDTADNSAHDRTEAYTVLVVYIWMHTHLDDNTDDSTILIGRETNTII